MADSLDLKFRPRYQIENFAAYYDGAEHTEISSDPMKPMSLITEATVSNTSLDYQDSGGAMRPAFDVNYQLDADSDTSDQVNGDMYLLMDTDDPANTVPSTDVEESHREEAEAANSPGTSYDAEYAMGYGQKASECGTVAGCSASTNTLSSPTAEQWVCDFVDDDFFQQYFDGESCYYTEYLPHTDRHVDPPEEMLVVGAINSVIDDTALLDEDYISVLGTAETIELRNKMYAQMTRYTLGQSPPGRWVFEGDGLEPESILELMTVGSCRDVTLMGVPIPAVPASIKLWW